MPKVEGSGFTVVTARGSVPLPLVARPLTDRRRPNTGLVWPVDPNPQIVRVIPPPKKKRPAPRVTRPASPPPTPEVVERMAAMYTAGQPLNVISKETQFSRSTIAKYLTRAGVQMRPPGNNVRFTTTEYTAPSPKECAYCGGQFEIRKGEAVRSFRLRTTCSPEHAGLLSAAKRLGKIQKREARDGAA